MGESAFISPLAALVFLPGVAGLGLGSQVALVTITMLESAFISVLALVFSPVEAFLGSLGTRGSARTTFSLGLTAILGLGIGVRSTMAVGALVSEAAALVLREGTADFNALLVVLGGLDLGLVLLACTAWASATTSAL